MFIIAYDISSDKVRTKFSKFLKKFGRKLQYSVVEVKLSERKLSNLVKEIEFQFLPLFTYTDSIIIWPVTDQKQNLVRRFGYSVQEEEDVVIFG